MNADKRRFDAVFQAESSFVIRGRAFVVVGAITNGQLNVGDSISYTDPETILSGRTILGVELISSMPKRGLVGLCIASDTDPDIEQLKTLPLEDVKIMIAGKN